MKMIREVHIIMLKICSLFIFNKLIITLDLLKKIICRYTPLKENWLKIFTPVVEHLHLQIRFNLKTRNVEIRTSAETDDIGNLQKAADFVKVFFCSNL